MAIPPSAEEDLGPRRKSFNSATGHALFLSAIEIAVSIVNAIEQDACTMATCPAVVFTCSAVIEIEGPALAVVLLMFPTLCTFEKSGGEVMVIEPAEPVILINSLLVDAGVEDVMNWILSYKRFLALFPLQAVSSCTLFISYPSIGRANDDPTEAAQDWVFVTLAIVVSCFLATLCLWLWPRGRGIFAMIICLGLWLAYLSYSPLAVNVMEVY